MDMTLTIFVTSLTAYPLQFWYTAASDSCTVNFDIPMANKHVIIMPEQEHVKRIMHLQTSVLLIVTLRAGSV